MSKEKALFSLTIGPVKSFVGNGRKMKDLYAGSAILSKLIKEAMVYIENKTDLKLILPVNDDTLSSFPNRLVARTEAFNENKHKKVANDLSDHIKGEFRTICDESLELIKDEEALSWAKKQLESFLDVYWLFEPFVEPYEKGKNYGIIYQNLFNNLIAVKNTRSFDQTDEPWGRKCILHPEYNALFYRKEDGSKPANLNINYALDLIPDPDDTVPAFEYMIKEKEALSAIAFVKRFYVGSEPSIFSMRDMVFRKNLELTPSKEDWQEWYVENVENVPANLRMSSHKSGFISCVINAIYDLYPKQVPSPQEKNETAKAEANDIIEKLKDKFPTLELKSYYALLKFDGDSMGDRYKELSDNEHEYLSEKICTFAREARKMIEEKGGVCIFAGGEDVLAALPLEEIWSMLKELHKKFGEIVNLENQPDFTFSAGIVIPHLMEPLKNVMNQIHDAEEHAKKYNEKEKNAFSVMLMKRGGEYRQIRYSFQKDASSYQSLKTFEQIIKECESQKQSKSFFSNAIQLLEKLPKIAKYGMVESLIKAVMKNQQIEEPEKLMCYIKKLYDESENLENFINTLDMIRFLASPAIIHNGGAV